jgi:hypothetical protein
MQNEGASGYVYEKSGEPNSLLVTVIPAVLCSTVSVEKSGDVIAK